nr:methyl-accepting chemotaxis protein [Aquabacterium sp. NJ1]
MSSVHALPIAQRMGLIIVSALLGVVALAATFLTSERTLIMAERERSVRQTVEVAHSLVKHFHQEVVSGHMNEEEGKRQALAAIKGLRYSETEYFWVNDMQPRMVMHATKPELDGQDLGSIKDPNGVPIFVEFVRTVKASGSGIVSYMWPRPGSDTPVPKVSYVVGFAPWGWVIGSGLYVDSVAATVWDRTLKFSMGTMALALLMLSVGLVISRGLLKQLGGEPAYAVALTHQLAAGDLSVDVALKPDDHDSLLHAIKSMRDSFASIVSQVRRSSDSVAIASTEIAHGNQDLSARTENQASALEQTAASMEQLSSTVKQNADNARQANQLAIGASSVAVKGGEVVSQVVDTMREINDSSKKIVDIIGVIDSIAFQTNILALNAAVEAARAGEQGRGFAVVAAEVRTLAVRSAGAAKEIKTLINDNVQRVGQGTDMVDQAGSTMNEVVHAIRRVTDIMGEISSASQEQSTGVAQIGQAVTQMDQATQQNAAMVEQMAAAASSLQTQAADLVSAISAFTVTRATGADQPSRP